MISDILVEKIKEAVLAKGYRFFEQGSYNVNIIGVRRSGDKVTNAFDDYLYILYKDEFGVWIVRQYNITTQPGKAYMKSPANRRGTAILVPGQYRGVYKIDKHSGKYDALCQRGGKVQVYRDNNRDLVYDLEGVQEGWFGINIHAAGKDSTYIDKWSAGCQVFKKKAEFLSFMDLMYKAEKEWSNSFTYTLLLEEDLK